jgi:hypothetical protein
MKTRLRDKIKDDIAEALNQHRGSPAWLNKAAPFNHSLKLNVIHKDRLDVILEVCNITKRKENDLNLEILIANLLLKRHRRPVRISLNTSDWKRTRYSRAGESTIKIIKKLHQHGYIKLIKGYNNVKEPRQARIWPTIELLKYFPEYPNNVIFDPVEVVELKDANGKRKDYKDTSKTREIREVLTRANRVNQTASIIYKGFKQYSLHASLVAVFRRKFTLYGRLHTKGHRHYQGLSSVDRKQILIKDDPVVELDFSGLHPHLLYAKEGIQLYKDPYRIDREHRVPRKLSKHILLCMLNSEDEISAERAINYWLFKHNYRRSILNKFGLSTRTLMTKFRNANKPIEHYFCNGNETGLRIMNLDSQIALDIVDHFAKRNMPILAIHDSFIVQEKYREELWLTMDSTYQKHTGGFRCKIK